jgi:hypothetical protein
MRVRLSTLAIGLVLLANALLLGGVAWNRAGEAEAVLALTERELALPYGRWGHRESTGVALSIRRADGEAEWLDRDKLAALGFEPDRFLRGLDAGRRSVERRVFVVLEFDGPAFSELLTEQVDRVRRLQDEVAAGEADRRRLEAAESELERLRTSASRLVLVDAGTAAAPLRRKYPDESRHAVMRALVRMYAHAVPGQDLEPVVRGRVGALLPGDVHVPRRHHAALRRATGGGRGEYDAPPRYRVVLKFGRRLEPWVAGIEAMPGHQSSD